jgi:hypothetical protein
MQLGPWGKERKIREDAQMRRRRLFAKIKFTKVTGNYKQKQKNQLEVVNMVQEAKQRLSE